MTHWRCAMELDSQRNLVSGSAAVLAEAIGRAADLRIGTAFRHNEHIDVTSPSNELITEVAEFGVTYLVDGSWTVGIMSLRQPIHLPVGFGPRSSMSFFLYNQDGQQAIARPYLDGQPATGSRGPAPVVPEPGMPKYHTFDHWDSGTNAPSHQFIYDFDYFRFQVSDSWREVLRHTSTGEALSGSLADLVEAFRCGCEVKMGIDHICADLSPHPEAVVPHELFVQGGPGYYYTEQKLFIIESHPLIRVQPGVPMKYASGNWDFGWVMLRTDGHAVYRRCDPYTLAFSDHVLKCGVRWFVR